MNKKTYFVLDGKEIVLITQKFYKSIGLTDEQIKAINKALKSEGRFRRILVNSGVHVSAIERIIAKTDISKTETMDDETLTEMVKEDWADFIIKGAN